MDIEKIIPGGMSLATAKDGKKWFFWNALPGETVVNYDITKNKSTYAEAIATELTNLSSHRIQSRDDCFLATSPWQIMDYDYELAQKSLLVQEVFRQHGINLDPPEVITDGNPYYYRNKMEYALYYSHEDEKIHLAFHNRGSHRKVPITHSSIERPEILSRALEIIDELNSKHADARQYQSLLLRANQSGSVSGGLFENHQPHPVFDNLTDTILGYAYSYSPNGFFQINLPVYELALKEIQKYITTDEVLDLYAGVGTIGLSVARDRKLTLVESNPSAFGELEKNCTSVATSLSTPETTPHEGSISAPTPILSSSEEALEYIKHDQTVILDPPRAGIDPKLAEKLCEVIPTMIIYLSCNPATQARDVAILRSDYDIIAVKTFNFFPRTPHIENLVILKHK